MIRPIALTILVLSISLFPGVSSAEDNADTSDSPELEYRNGNWVRVPPVPGINIASEHVSKLLFLNRCRGGCTVGPGNNDARLNTSRIVS
ncbi:MAG: hypothetical protein JKY56_24805, partial [Kofleriaceae bacterium]|nr:hypothetical protein [Kofleriaceae bacterium]